MPTEGELWAYNLVAGVIYSWIWAKKAKKERSAAEWYHSSAVWCLSCAGRHHSSAVWYVPSSEWYHSFAVWYVSSAERCHSFTVWYVGAAKRHHSSAVWCISSSGTCHPFAVWNVSSAVTERSFAVWCLLAAERRGSAAKIECSISEPSLLFQFVNLNGHNREIEAICSFRVGVSWRSTKSCRWKNRSAKTCETAIHSLTKTNYWFCLFFVTTFDYSRYHLKLLIGIKAMRSMRRDHNPIAHLQ